MNQTDPTQRFTNRVENYARYRPGYPAAVLDSLRDECGLDVGTEVADVGSGTGILTRLLLERGARVHAVEPNDAMRAAAETALGELNGFISVKGRAEATGLPDAGMDIITAGQAFHWFEPVATRVEFRRILRPRGWVALVWNTRDEEGGGFAADYEALLREFAYHYQEVRREARADNKDILFPDGYETRLFHHERHLGYPEIQGGLLSASYAPLEGDPRYGPMIARLREIFDVHQRNGSVVLPYRTELYFGRLDGNK